MWAPRIDLGEALALMTADFVDAIKNGKRPLTDGRGGLKVVQILEAAQKSLRSGGVLVDIV
jgi:predicted dehydrogenase